SFGVSSLAFLKCSSASSCMPSDSALSPCLYSSAASPRSFPSACAFLIFGRSSFLSSVAVCAHAGSAAASAVITTVVRIRWRMAGPPKALLTSGPRGAQARFDRRARFRYVAPMRIALVVLVVTLMLPRAARSDDGPAPGQVVDQQTVGAVEALLLPEIAARYK